MAVMPTYGQQGLEATAPPTRPEVFVRLGHTEPIFGMAISPDGRFLASGDFSGQIKVWDIETRQELTRMVAFPKPGVNGVSGLAFHRDGRLFAIGFISTQVAVFSTGSGEILKTWSPSGGGAQEKMVTAMALSPDGATLALAFGPEVALWNANDYSLVASLGEIDVNKTILALAWHSDGQRLAIGADDRVQIWNTGNRSKITEFKTANRISALRFLPQGGDVLVGFGAEKFPTVHLGSGPISNGAVLYSSNSGQEITRFSGVGGYVTSIDVSPDMRRIAIATSGRDNENQTHVWDRFSGKLLNSYIEQSGSVMEVRFHPEQPWLFSAGDKSVIARRVDTSESRIFAGIGVEGCALAQDGGDVYSVDPAGRVSVWGADDGVMKEMLSRGQVVLPKGLRDYIDQEGGPEKLAAKLSERPQERVQLQSLLTAPEVRGCGHHVAGMSVDNQRARLLWLYEGSGVEYREWSPRAKIRHEIAVTPKWIGPNNEAPIIFASSLSPNGSLVALGLAWATPSTDPVEMFFRTPRTQFALVPADEIATLAASGDLPTKRSPMLAGVATRVSLSPDARYLLLLREIRSVPEGTTMQNLAATAIRTQRLLSLWDTRSLRMLWEKEQSASSDVLTFSADGKYVFVRDTVFEIESGEPMARFNGALVERAVFSKKGFLLAIGMVGGGVEIWDVESRTLMRRLRNSEGVIAMMFDADNSILYVTASDQTLRRWRLSDGVELTASAVFKTGDWATLTPEGFFAGSPGGIEQIGFRQGNRLFGLNQFYDVFYRPDAVRRKLAGDDMALVAAATLESALTQPPPQIGLIGTPSASSVRVSVVVRVSNTGGGIGDVRVFHNGKLVRADPPRALDLPGGVSIGDPPDQTVARGERQIQAAKNQKPAQKSKGNLYEETIWITPVNGENVITATGLNADNSVQSQVRTLRFGSTVSKREPRVFVLAIGINRFNGPAKFNLKYAVKDARDFVQMLARHANALALGKLTRVTTLTDRHATRSNILTKLAKLAKATKPDDAVIVFFASHGAFLGSTYALITHESDGIVRVGNSITGTELIEALRKIPAYRQLAIVDTCYAGGISDSLSSLFDARMTVFARNSGMFLFASAGTLQPAIDGYQGNGLFTYHLLRGTSDRAADADKDGLLSVGELGGYAQRLTREVALTLGYRQTPVIFKRGEDLPLLPVAPPSAPR